MKLNASCYFYPTTVVCVDDDFDLLKWLKTVLQEQNRVVDFHTPFECSHFLKNESLSSADNQYISAEHDFNKTNLSVYINKIHEIIYNEQRINEISTLVIDYYMPGIDGLSLCRSFDDKLYKKIMLTGEADQALAVKAFNDGIIDQFVMNGQTDSIQTVQGLVQKMQAQFFINKTAFIIESLLKLDPHMFGYFTDAAFCEKLQSLLKDHKIKELYLFNDLGDYLLIDATDKLWWLSIKNQYACKALTQEAKSAFLEEPSPEAEAVYKTIESGQKLPLFALSKEALDILDWKDILVDPISIKTTQDHYQVLLSKDIGKTALRYKEIQFLKMV